jgi:hypothetical protein
MTRRGRNLLIALTVSLLMWAGIILAAVSAFSAAGGQR